MLYKRKELHLRVLPETYDMLLTLSKKKLITLNSLVNSILDSEVLKLEKVNKKEVINN